MSIRLTEHDRIEAAWAENCSGPGWSNSPVKVLIYTSTTGRHRVEYIQPQEQTSDMVLLHRASSAMSETMLAAVRAYAQGGDHGG